ncbi:hypothetical protein BHM03_00048590 [Ensete ventricosum]|nr:hypothetical protein BHM03_00048590 [Ensete ventricosum]
MCHTYFTFQPPTDISFSCRRESSDAPWRRVSIVPWDGARTLGRPCTIPCMSTEAFELAILFTSLSFAQLLRSLSITSHFTQSHLSPSTPLALSTVKFGCQRRAVALEHFRAKYPESSIEEDHFAKQPEDANVRMEACQPFDDSTPEE